MISDIIYRAERSMLDTLSGGKVEFLSIEQTDSLCERVAEQLKADRFKPDRIVGILNAGLYPAKKLSQLLDVPYCFIDISRPRWYLFSFELTGLIFLPKVINAISPRHPKLNHPFCVDINDHSVLIVDEDTTTGETIEIAKSQMSGAKNIRTACIFSYHGHYITDYIGATFDKLPGRFVKGPKRHPWLPYSPHYKEFLDAYSELP